MVKSLYELNFSPQRVDEFVKSRIHQVFGVLFELYADILKLLDPQTLNTKYKTLS